MQVSKVVDLDLSGNGRELIFFETIKLIEAAPTTGFHLHHHIHT